MPKAIFLDRDGTINIEKDYLFQIEEFEFIPGVIRGLQLLQYCGFKLVIITNQSGVARGYYREQDVNVLHAWLKQELEKQGIRAEGIYYCPHHPHAMLEQYRKICDCRKPGTGLFYRAARDLDIEFDGSYAIGDKLRDCAICKETACKGFLIGENEDEDILSDVRTGKIERISYAEDLYTCAKIICGAMEEREK